ncbi:MAG TPA: MBL fold metallo-hydrolase [Thermotogota bacterium]|nr:MBL fold metallo-hydrolase [Thermotogota bacterium]HPJ87878.1 MBL fold metallo-hydrolase [Thermotogota bacterium]HPR94971.1 MBL fold metallo-hydrolase [Thermotogota bacterium]
MKELEKGIIVFDNPYGGSNITAITTGEGTLVVDSSLFPSKAAEVVLYIKRLMKSEVIMLTNTHYHPDHSFGNSGINAPLLASEKTEGYLSMMNHEYIDQVTKKDSALLDEDIKIVHPAITFKKEHTLTLGDLRIEFELAGGHTPDSTIIRIPERKVIILGDLLVSEYHPEIVMDSNVEKWIKILKQLKREKAKWFITGHGKVCNRLEIDRMISYLQKTAALGEFVNTPETIVEALGQDSNFRDRKMQSLLIENIKVIMEKASSFS